MAMNRKLITIFILMLSVMGFFIASENYKPKLEIEKTLLIAENTTQASASEDINVCQDFRSTFKSIGIVLFILRILVPLGIAGMGMVDFSNSVMKGDQNQIKKDAEVLGKRIIIGLIIFISPGIIKMVISLADPENASDYTECNECVFSPFDC